MPARNLVIPGSGWSSSVRKVFVIGCGGYIGSHTLDELLRHKEIEVVGLDVNTDKIASHLGRPSFRLIRSLVQNTEAEAEIKDAIEWSDVVINLAAICNPADYNTRPLEVIRSNFIHAYPLVDWCSNVGRWLVHYSTSEIYGRTLSSYLGEEHRANKSLYVLKENETPLIMGPIVKQRWSYATAKQLMERYIFAHHFENDLPFTVVRPLNFFGPKMDFIPGRDGEGTPRILACIMTALINREPILLVDSGQARRTILSIRDATRGLVHILHNRQNAVGRAFNFGNPANEVSMAELATIMRDIYAEVTGDVSFRSHAIQTVTGEEFYGPGYEDCDRRMPSVQDAANLLGWRPTIPLHDALLEAIQYYHDAYATVETTN